MKRLGLPSLIVIFIFSLLSCNTRRQKLAKELFLAIGFFDAPRVQKALDDGADPNYCDGEAGWIDSNPLSTVSWYCKISYFGVKHIYPNPTPEVVIVRELLQAGADINRRPYVWKIVYRADNNILKDIAGRTEYGKLAEESVIKARQYQFIHDVNRLLKTFLESGADPDTRGSAEIYSDTSRINVWMLTDKRANQYFAKGTHPINEAIKKGMMWESQVDLLLQYTKLDEDSLKAAQESNDQAMIAKINRLWQIQQHKLMQNENGTNLESL